MLGVLVAQNIVKTQDGATDKTQDGATGKAQDGATEKARDSATGKAQDSATGKAQDNTEASDIVARTQNNVDHRHPHGRTSSWCGVECLHITHTQRGYPTRNEPLPKKKMKRPRLLTFQ